MTFLEKLNALKLKNGIKRNAELARRSGIPYTTIDGLYKRGYKNIKLTTLLALCNFFKVPLDYLARDDVDTLEQAQDILDEWHDELKAVAMLSPEEQESMRKYRLLDEYGLRAVNDLLAVEYERCTAEEPEEGSTVEYRRYTSPAAAGAPLWAESDYELISCSPEEVPDGADYAVIISGSSMEPAIHNGSTVWVQRSEFPSDGDIVVAWIDGEGTVCKQVELKDGQVRMLHSINPDYPDIVGEDLNGMRIYGIVVGTMKESE